MKRTVVLSATVVVALVVACMAALLVAMSLAKPAEAAFPGTNGKIAFNGYARINSGYTDGIYTTLPASFGSFAITNITEGRWPTGSYPTWSPDGNRIAFERYPDKGDDFSDIYVMNANGTREKRLTDSAGHDYAPAWSPDGTKIAFSSDRPDSYGYASDIFIMDADGTNVRRLTNESLAQNSPEYSHTSQPAWSPDGTKIAYLSQSFEFDWAIFTINVDGTGRKVLTRNPSLGYALDFDAQPDWSPDGQRIVFRGYVYDPATEDDDPFIYVMNADGTEQRQLRVGTSPAWSPNGKKIVYVMDGTNEIATMNPDGSHRTIRTNTPGLWVYAPDWQPRP